VSTMALFVAVLLTRTATIADTSSSAVASSDGEASASPANILRVRSALKGTLVVSRAPAVTLLTPDRVTSDSLWRVRIEPELHPFSWGVAFAAYEQRIRLASSAAALANAALPQVDAEGPFRLVALEGSLASGPSFSYWHEVDRLGVTLQLPKLEITAGRQPIGWGRGVLFSAVDVFAPFSPLEIDREWRRGVDAVHADAQLSSWLSIDAVAVGARTLKGSAYAARLRGYLGSFDAELAGGYRADDWFGAATISAAVFDAEVHGEVAFFRLGTPWLRRGIFDDDRNALKAVLGGSYVFQVGDGLRLVGEYAYSGFGVSFPVSASELALDEAFRDRLMRGDFQLLGRHALALVASYTFSPSVSGAFQWIQDPVDGSGVIAPNLAWDLAESVSLVGAAYLGYGPGISGVQIGSQFGTTPLSVLVQLRVYDQREPF
jgi:hypothetical protein